MAVQRRAVEAARAPLVLIAGPEPGDGVGEVLSRAFRVLRAADAAAAERELLRSAPDIVILDLAHEGALAVCRAAKRLYAPAAVLVTTADAARVPDALDAGCDAVLLQPFPPNLLFSRLGRLTRDGAGTNQIWPDLPCPSCAHRGVTSFEFASHRRAWYACPACRHVWMGYRKEGERGKGKGKGKGKRGGA